MEVDMTSQSTKNTLDIEKVIKPVIETAEKKVEPVIETAKSLFLAGLGLIALAKKEGEKLLQDSEKTLKTLAKEGEKFEKDLEKQAKTTVNKVTKKAEGRLQAVRKNVEKTFSKAEKIVEKRVEKTMENIGVPTVDDIKKLDRRIAELQKEIKNLNESKRAA